MTPDFYKELRGIKRIHMIGIGGISMSAIALMLKKYDYEITGSDKNHGDMVDILEKNGISVYIGSNAELVKNCDAVVYTSAINLNDPEFIRAKSLNIPTYERAVFLGMLLKSYEKAIAISGTHGKTTTTSMIASVLIDAHLSPNVQVGSKLEKLNGLNYTIGNSEYFVLEACEYVDSFLKFPHHTAVILNIEEDHLDYFSGIEEIKRSFKKFILMLPENGILVINIDDLNCVDILKEVREELEHRNITVYRFSLSEPTATIYARNISCNVKGLCSFTVKDPKTKKDYNFYLTVPGIHNVYNAIATIAACHAHNVPMNIMQESLHKFNGAKRRFEFRKELENNVLVYDDYAHHPTEIKSTLAAAKQTAHNKIIAVFQPHTYSRTKELLDDFSLAFFDADVVIIPDIYAAREVNDGSISSNDLIRELKKNNVNATYISDFSEIADHIHEILEPNDVVFTIGAGDITNLADMIY